jgi:hypothetical protein
MEFLDLYEQQIRRWRTENPSAAQNSELDRIEKVNREPRAATADVLALALELRTGSIDRVLEMIDLEIGLQTLLRAPIRPSLNTPQHCVHTLSYAFVQMGLPPHIDDLTRTRLP